MALTKVSRGLLSTGIVDNSNATAITIDSSENVGIGGSPSAWSSAFGSVMQLNSGSGGGALSGSGTDNFRMFANTYYDGAYKKIGTGFSTMYEQASGSHIWYSNASSSANATFTPTERMRLDSSGNLSVFGASGSKMISVDSDSIANNEQAGVFAYGGARNAGMSVYKHAGITNPCAYLGSQRQNGTQDFVWVSDAGNYMLSTNSAFIGTTSGNVIGAQTSDERLKDIEPAFEYGLAEIMQLVPIAYTMKDDVTAKRMLGFGAQASQGVVPELVYDTGDCIDGYDVDPDNKMIQTACSERTKLGMEYFQAVPVLVKAIQEQQATIEVLTQRIETLENN